MKRILLIALLVAVCGVSAQEPRPGDLQSTMGRDSPEQAKPSELPLLKPPEYVVLHVLLNTVNDMNFDTGGRGRNFLHRKIGFSREGAGALLAYARAAEAKLNPARKSLKSGLCPQRRELTSNEALIRAAQIVDSESRAQSQTYVDGAYNALDDADDEILRAFLAARSDPMSKYPLVNWPMALASVDRAKFLGDLCDRESCPETFNSNFEAVPGKCAPERAQ